MVVVAREGRVVIRDCRRFCSLDAYRWSLMFFTAACTALLWAFRGVNGCRRAYHWRRADCCICLTWAGIGTCCLRSTVKLCFLTLIWCWTRDSHCSAAFKGRRNLRAKGISLIDRNCWSRTGGDAYNAVMRVRAFVRAISCCSFLVAPWTAALRAFQQRSENLMN